MLASEQFRIRAGERHRESAKEDAQGRSEGVPALVGHNRTCKGAAHPTPCPSHVSKSVSRASDSAVASAPQTRGQDDSVLSRALAAEPLSPGALLYRALQFQYTHRLPPREMTGRSSTQTVSGDLTVGSVPHAEAATLRAGQTSADADAAAAAAATTHNKLDAEDDEGDVEYKWRLIGVTPERLEHLVTQMQFRVTEGKGQCLYELGVADDGTVRGLPRADFDASIETIETMAGRLGLEVNVLQRCTVCTGPAELWCGEVMVSRRHAGAQDVSVAFCGAVGTGKSTLIGVLLSATLDDGSGGLRQSLFNHKHEVDSGRTSSIATRLWSVHYEDPKPGNGELESARDEGSGGGGLVRSRRHNTEEDEEAVAPATATAEARGTASHSAWHASLPYEACTARPDDALPVRLISLTDLGGDITKTMLFGLMSRHPDYICLCVAANSRAEATLLYAQVCRVMRLPFFVVVTMCDLVEDFALDGMLMDLAAVLHQAGCACDVVEDDETVLRYAHDLLPRHRGEDDVARYGGYTQHPLPVAAAAGVNELDTSPSDRSTASFCTCSTETNETEQVRVPVFCVSCVTGGAGLGRFRLCLAHLRRFTTPPEPERQQLLRSSSSTATVVAAAKPAFEVLLDHDFVVQHVGPVVQGRVVSCGGAVEVGCECFIGPDVAGGFHAVVIRGIHVDGAHVNHALPGDEATFALDALPTELDLSQKGKVLVRERPAVCTNFTVVVRLLSQSVTDQLQPILFTRNARQAVRIRVRIGDDAVRGKGGELELDCEFMFRPEVVVEGAPVVLRWDPSGLAVGRVTACAIHSR